MPDKNLYFFTNSYPYQGETFVGNEINALAPMYNKVFLFSTVKGSGVIENLPENVELRHIDNDKRKSGILFSNIFLICRIFWLDLIKNRDKKKFFKDLRYNLSLLLKVISGNEQLEEMINADPLEKNFVCFWMDEWTLALSILKYKKKIANFVFRVHQHDLYRVEDPLAYIPFRFFNIKMTTAVFPDSKRGVKFLKDFNYYPEKMHVGHLGVLDKGNNPYPDREFVMVSCSALVSRKRVDLIADVLKHVNIPLTWIHFGTKGESENALEELKNKCDTLPKNIKVILKGEVSYTELINFYIVNPVSLFITLSKAEGLPVSVIEATSFGIPVLATDIMGLPDVVTEESGIIVSPDEKKEKIAEVITGFAKSSKNTLEFRIRVKNFWKQNFNSEVNYPRFYKFLN